MDLSLELIFYPFCQGSSCGNKHCDEKDDLASYETSVLVTSLISIAFCGYGNFFVGL